jgi:hypothetical protein
LFCESDQSAVDTCSTWMLDFGSKAFSKLPLELLNTQAVFTSGLEAVIYVNNAGHLKKYTFQAERSKILALCKLSTPGPWM